MEARPVLELRVRDAAELRDGWLESDPGDGLFVPGGLELGAGTEVVVRVVIEGATPSITHLVGTVAFRRLSAPSAPPMGRGVALLRRGVGITFDEDSRARARYLDRLARGVASEARAHGRYLCAIPVHVALRAGEPPVRATLEELGPRGARVTVAGGAIATPASRVVVAMRSTELAVAGALGATVVWIDRVASNVFGAAFELATREERALWARVVTRAREAIERHAIAVERLD